MMTTCRRFRIRCARRPKPAPLAMLRKAMGDWVVDHYTRCAEWSRKRSTRRNGLGNRTRFREGLTTILTKQCISPIDGSVYRARGAVACTMPFAIAAKSPRGAGGLGGYAHLHERIALVNAGANEPSARDRDACRELAHQMGRPVRYGGEFGGVRERAATWPSIAEEALASIVTEDSEPSSAGSSASRMASSSSSRRGTTPT
jgi:hypothetical protein